LRRYDLAEKLEGDQTDLLVDLQQQILDEPDPEKVAAFAELAYISGKRAQDLGKDAEALDLYAGSVSHAYLYLFDDLFDGSRNPYDPQFRRVCDLYNVALESAMRIVNKHDGLKPGKVQRLKIGDQEIDVEVVLRGTWPAEDIHDIEFASDYEIKGLTNHYHTFGLGVPLIAVRNASESDEPADQFYPPGLSFPVTAFLRVSEQEHLTGDRQCKRRHCVLELYDPLAATDIVVAGRSVPLETDLSTPLAYLLNQPAFREKDMATTGLLKPEVVMEAQGLYMLERFDPRKIPVLMVHGLWSSPMTWMEMFNDLRAMPEIRDNYQFWFYLYPTGQPFWISATELRSILREARESLDPEYKAVALDQMVLVGHSMGGLVSRWQTIESDDDLWNLISDRPPEELQGSPEDKAALMAMLFFQPNPSVRRVITIGTPHRGSDFANDYTRWFARNLIALPEIVVRRKQRIVADNPGFFRDTELLRITTSIDSLAPDSPVLPVLLHAKRPPWIEYNNIVGVVPQEGFLASSMTSVAGEGDGVVAYTSAHLEDAESEIDVPADHGNVHRHPRSVLEVRRILLEHINQVRQEYISGTDPRKHVRPANCQLPSAAESPTNPFMHKVQERNDRPAK
jgi:pimeloyl-ACP methyl ester carboxylesterase